MKTSHFLKSIVSLLMLMSVGIATAERLKDMAVVSGQRPNQLIGYGLVVGLEDRKSVV